MKPKKSVEPKRDGTARSDSDSTEAVNAFMDKLSHPHKDAITLLRTILCAASPSIQEGVKWNAPSFHTGGYFATIHLKAKTGIAIVFHLGAKARLDTSLEIKDPLGLLKWLGKDRAIVEFENEKSVSANRVEFTKIVKQWIRFV